MASSSLPPDALRRYARQLALPGVGVEGQSRLARASVVLVGAGGLGSPLALYLAAAGVGRLVLVDGDRVDLTNLHRQVLYSTDDLGRPKVEAAADRLRALNPDVSVECHAVRVDAGNAMDLLARGDVVADGSDNFPARYVVSDACVLLGRPNAHGAIHRFEGQVSWFDARTGPCYRCLHPEPPPPGLVPSCAEAGVLGALPGVIGALQATEVLKYLLGTGDLLAGRVLAYDALTLSFRELRLRKDPDCPSCGPRATIRSPADLAGYCGVPTAAEDGARARSPGPSTLPATLSAAELHARLGGPDAPLPVDVREEWEFRRGALPGAVHVPLAALPARWTELPKDRDLVLYCHLGVRSLHAMEFLRGRGLSRIASLDGGTEAWAEVVDPSFPRY